MASGRRAIRSSNRSWWHRGFLCASSFVCLGTRGCRTSSWCMPGAVLRLWQGSWFVDSGWDSDGNRLSWASVGLRLSASRDRRTAAVAAAVWGYAQRGCGRQRGRSADGAVRPDYNQRLPGANRTAVVVDIAYASHHALPPSAAGRVNYPLTACEWCFQIDLLPVAS